MSSRNLGQTLKENSVERLIKKVKNNPTKNNNNVRASTVSVPLWYAESDDCARCIRGGPKGSRVLFLIVAHLIPSAHLDQNQPYKEMKMAKLKDLSNLWTPEIICAENGRLLRRRT